MLIKNFNNLCKSSKKNSKNINHPIASGDIMDDSDEQLGDIMDDSDEELTRVLDQYDEDLKVSCILQNHK